MKQVSIRNIVIPSRSRSGNYPTGSTVIPGGGGSNATIDLSKYMKLALWLENFEAKTDTDGNQYIYAKKPLVSVGGFIAYCSDEAHVPSIFEGIPIDNDTIYWDESTGVRILKAKGSGGEAGSVAWENVTNKPSWIGITKPSYNWSEIGSKPTTLGGYGITANDVLNTLKTVDGVNSGLNADLLDGLHVSSFFRENLLAKQNLDADNLDTFYAQYAPIGDMNTWDGTSFTNFPKSKPAGGFSLLVLGEGNYRKQIYSDYNDNHLYTRTQYYSNGIKWNKWSTVALTTDNVASATKLQTARTIWGQNFDGTGGVSGELSQCTRIYNAASNPIYLGNSNNSSWVYTQDIASSNGNDKWAININGSAWFKKVNIGYTYSAEGTYSLNVNGIAKANAFMSDRIRIECDNDGVFGSRSGEINNYLAPLQLQYNTSQQLHLCYGGGNVGIGTLSPSYKLDVDGDIHANYGWLRTSGNYGWYSQSYDGGWYMIDYTYVRSYNGKKVYSGGGYLAPYGGSMWITMATRSDIIDGDQNQSTNGAHALYRVKTSGGHAVVFGGLDNSVGFYGFYKSRIDTNENGTDWSTTWDATNGTITHRGNFLATGGITCYASDQRAKTVIEQISLSLKQIANAPTIRFKWNNWKIKDDGKTHIGGIAQYMQKLLPETVLEADNMLNMDYATTGYIFAVQTAKHLIKTDTEVERLKKRVKRLEKRLKQLGYEEANIMDD